MGRGQARLAHPAAQQVLHGRGLGGPMGIRVVQEIGGGAARWFDVNGVSRSAGVGGLEAGQVGGGGQGGSS